MNPFCVTPGAYARTKEGAWVPVNEGLTRPQAAVHGLGSLFASHKVDSTSIERARNRNRDGGATHASLVCVS